MTIEATIRGEASSTHAWPLWIASALAGWVALVISITATLEPVSTVIVAGPITRIEAAIRHADVQIIDAGPGYVIVSGATAGFVGKLYAGGALLVLPRRLGGCISRFR